MTEFDRASKSAGATTTAVTEKTSFDENEENEDNFFDIKMTSIRPTLSKRKSTIVQKVISYKNVKGFQ